MTTPARPDAPTAIPPGAPTATSADAPATRGALTLLAMAVTAVLWASAFVGVRAVGHDLDAGALTLGRVAVGSVALTVMVLVVHARRRTPVRLPRGRVLVLVLAWGVAWFGAYNLTLNAAEQHLDAGTTALLVNIAPMLVAVLAGFLLGEGFPRRLLVGIAIAFTGIVVIAVATTTGRFDAVGVLLGLATAVLYAGAATLQKRLLPHADALTMTWLGCLAGTVAALPFLPALVTQAGAAPASSLLGVVYLGIFPTAIAFSTWAYVLKRVSAGRAAASTYSVPPLVVLMSWVLLDEVPVPVVLVGGVLALAGVAVATLPRRAARAR
ncbi:DMT family transporter [Krasilnikoviella flava]|uniref:Permease of the drug/metabolite transporter (DMT) superfamily n=1 Tax=Krasilnikoviella flava TaxID=526729 RepID=A0A1T5ICN3_9MICO|nr:DMT family transporter [Krasilnikoviella flava]SKC36961.1 Permease of the drug/metabolite transporter (DMT) superfamily [Krasilnikoviella flava]